MAGRPREFDLDQALDRALKVFWRNGFEGTSLDDLTRAMRISRPSLYAAFGNKQALFRRAMERYVSDYAGHVRQALAEPTARGVVEQLWRGTIERVTAPRQPRGCFLVQGALACGDEAEGLRREAVRLRQSSEALLAERFRRAAVEGDLPPDSDPLALAKFATTVSQGLSVQAAGGASGDALRRVAAIALAAWPAASKRRSAGTTAAR